MRYAGHVSNAASTLNHGKSSDITGSQMLRVDSWSLSQTNSSSFPSEVTKTTASPSSCNKTRNEAKDSVYSRLRDKRLRKSAKTMDFGEAFV